ncbi:hypothetical protein SNEBB_000534 [Seison nebaliae]|nr:hypothetical protein SNEBB_000534 [Seison nebaliae]
MESATETVEFQSSSDQPSFFEQSTSNQDESIRGIRWDDVGRTSIILMFDGTHQQLNVNVRTGYRVLDLRKYLALHTEMLTNHMTLRYTNLQAILMDSDLISELSKGEDDHVHLTAASIDSGVYPLGQFIDPTPKTEHADIIINVRKDEGCGLQQLQLEVERNSSRKPYLGGYRNKLTGTEYHNASTQTFQGAKRKNDKLRHCRDTQTYSLITKVIQTCKDSATQMDKPGLHITSTNTRIVTAGKYQTAAERLDFVVGSVIIIQKYCRRWLAKKHVERVRRDIHNRLKYELEVRALRQATSNRRAREDYERRMEPKSDSDFGIVYSALRQLTDDKLKEINMLSSDAAKKAAKAVLLDEKAQQLRNIDTLKKEATLKAKEKRITNHLLKSCKPKKWVGSNGFATEVLTPYNLRSKQLLKLYESLRMFNLTTDERLDVLLSVKQAIEEHDCLLTQEILELIDREVSLTVKGFKSEYMDSLRDRIAILFRQYANNPQFNPAMAQVNEKKAFEKASIDANHWCTSCNKYKPTGGFEISTSKRHIGKCMQCADLENVSHKQIDYSKFKFMLQQIQEDEERISKGKSKICYLLVPADIAELFHKIWGGHSAMSEAKHHYQLKFCRWRKDEEWSPWNCVLLTEQETISHLQMPSEKSYGDVFVKSVEYRHVQARKCFQSLPKIYHDFVERLRIESEKESEELEGNAKKAK